MAASLCKSQTGKCPKHISAEINQFTSDKKCFTVLFNSAKVIKTTAILVSSPAIYFARNSQNVVLVLMDFMMTFKRQVYFQKEFS